MIRKKVFFICRVNQEVGYRGVGDDVVNLDMGATFRDVCPGVWGFVIRDGDLGRDGKGAAQSFKEYVKLFAIAIVFSFFVCEEE